MTIRVQGLGAISKNKVKNNQSPVRRLRNVKFSIKGRDVIKREGEDYYGS
jgi:hypothetical protein